MRPSSILNRCRRPYLRWPRNASGLRTSALVVLFDIDGALEERAVFNHDALRADIANQRAGLAQFHASGGGDVAFNPAMDNQIARCDVWP